MKKITFFMVLLSIFFISSCRLLHRELLLSGRTMGTFYHVKIAAPFYKLHRSKISEKIEKVLNSVNSSMSIFDEKSEISRFNMLASGEKMKVSRDFIKVLMAGSEIYAKTGGKWDATVCGLVNLWGFGSSEWKGEIPGGEDIKKVLSSTGYNLIKYDTDSSMIWKKRENVKLDLGSIAKGYGVDRVSLLLKSMGFNDFMVEIGGEVSTSGKNIRGEKWVIGISRPVKDSAPDDIFRLISISGKSIATSGSYRNYISKDGRSFSHIIDPSTGYPVEERVVSVSVISDECVFSDGLATGLMGMKPERGVLVCDGINGVECMIVEKKKGGFKIHESAGFKNYLVN